MERPISLVALALAALALVLPFLRGPEAPPPATVVRSGPDPATVNRIAELERSLEELRAEVAVRPAAASSPEITRRAIDQEAAAARALAKASARVAELESSIESRLQNLAGEIAEMRATQDPLAALFTRTEPEGDVGTWQLTATDPRASAEDRLAALNALRSADWNGEDARTPEVVASMIDLAANSEDPEVRADVWRQLDEVTDPAMLQPLLSALANDPNPEVREEAAETLAPFLPDPTVEAALRDALANDGDRDVREQAGESLGR